eukprot:13921295-Alexandrium_andersonii.AAC.1
MAPEQPQWRSGGQAANRHAHWHAPRAPSGDRDWLLGRWQRRERQRPMVLQLFLSQTYSQRIIDATGFRYSAHDMFTSTTATEHGWHRLRRRGNQR